MPVVQEFLSIDTRSAGMIEITDEVTRIVAASGIATGSVSVFCPHTSCSLVIMENADATARQDLERWLARLVPEDDPDFRHTQEGPDDMPSHIKMALTRTTEILPVGEGRMLLGTWQGIFLWEHRTLPHQRRLIVTVQGE